MEDFKAFVRTRSAALARTAYLLTGDRQLAEDLLQDALTRLAERWTTVVRRGDPEP
ncbi:MAG TPA: sigma factor [Jiangellaceae bacterium]